MQEALAEGGGGGRIGARLWGGGGAGVALASCGIAIVLGGHVDRACPRRKAARGARRCRAAPSALPGRYGGLCGPSTTAGCRNGHDMAADAGRRAALSREVPAGRIPSQYPWTASRGEGGRSDAGPWRRPPLGGRAPCDLAVMPGICARRGFLAGRRCPARIRARDRRIRAGAEPALRAIAAAARGPAAPPRAEAGPLFARPGYRSPRFTLSCSLPGQYARMQPKYWQNCAVFA